MDLGEADFSHLHPEVSKASGSLPDTTSAEREAHNAFEHELEHAKWLAHLAVTQHEILDDTIPADMLLAPESMTSAYDVSHLTYRLLEQLYGVNVRFIHIPDPDQQWLLNGYRMIFDGDILDITVPMREALLDAGYPGLFLGYMTNDTYIDTNRSRGLSQEIIQSIPNIEQYDDPEEKEFYVETMMARAEMTAILVRTIKSRKYPVDHGELKGLSQGRARFDELHEMGYRPFEIEQLLGLLNVKFQEFLADHPEYSAALASYAGSGAH